MNKSKSLYCAFYLFLGQRPEKSRRLNFDSHESVLRDWIDLFNVFQSSGPKYSSILTNQKYSPKLFETFCKEMANNNKNPNFEGVNYEKESSNESTNESHVDF